VALENSGGPCRYFLAPQLVRMERRRDPVVRAASRAAHNARRKEKAAKEKAATAVTKPGKDMVRAKSRAAQDARRRMKTLNAVATGLHERSQCLSVKQPYCMLSCLFIKDYEGQPRRLGGLNGPMWVWLASCQEPLAFTLEILRQRLQTVGLALESPVLLERLGVHSITPDNFAALFPLGVVCGKVFFGSAVPRIEHSNKMFIPVAHRVVYPITDAGVLPAAVRFKTRGCNGRVWDLVLADCLDKHVRMIQQ
jgi:hypothetical protein